MFDITIWAFLSFTVNLTLSMGQRIKSFYFEVFSGGNWKKYIKDRLLETSA